VIRVIRGVEVKPGIWAYSVCGYGVEGRSRQPLLDACRRIKRISEAAGSQQIGIYRQGREIPDLVCTVDTGARLTVNETTTRFAKWRPLDAKIWKNS
jgi:hypothetical protein